MSLRAAGNRATNEAEAGRQGLGRTLFWPVHDASLMIWSPNRACSLCHMSLDATKCNKTQHFWHFRGCCIDVAQPPLAVISRCRRRKNSRGRLFHIKMHGTHHFQIFAHRTASQHHRLWIRGTRHTSHASKCIVLHHFFDFFPTPIQCRLPRSHCLCLVCHICLSCIPELIECPARSDSHARTGIIPITRQ